MTERVSRMRQIIEEVQPEQAKTLFGPDFSASDAEDLQGKIKAPYVSVHTSSLGGRERLTIMVTVSWQPKDQWKQGILQNSNYAMFSFYQDGTVEQFQLSVYDERMMRIKASKWRKTKVKSMDDFVSKLNTYIEKVTKEIEHHG